MPELTQEQANITIHNWLNNPNIRQEIAQQTVQDTSFQQLLQSRCALLLPNGGDVIFLHQNICSLSNIYTPLTIADLSDIVNGMRHNFAGLAQIEVRDFGDPNHLGHLQELVGWIKQQLQVRLHCAINKIKLSAVSRIINAVFGNIPVFTKGLKRCLYKLGFLTHQYTENIGQCVQAIVNFLTQHWEDVLNTAQYIYQLQQVLQMPEPGIVGVCLFAAGLITSICHMFQNNQN